ncbi:hypothetical protein [Gorillibacterium sp. sgz500922]|uniref:hypothetical protein n=1 Tax=Gorillibacterium sp. sgz500922 TaxID=3446694 RepID=UPI003F66D73E
MATGTVITSGNYSVNGAVFNINLAPGTYYLYFYGTGKGTYGGVTTGYLLQGSTELASASGSTNAYYGTFYASTPTITLPYATTITVQLDARLMGLTSQSEGTFTLYQTLPSFSVKVGGEWKTVTRIYANIGGTWRPVNLGYVNVGGTWRSIRNV